MAADDSPLRAPLNGLSHVRGVQTPALSDRTIGEWLDDTAGRWPEHLACAFRDSGLRFTWAQLRDEADRLAAVMAFPALATWLPEQLFK